MTNALVSLISRIHAIAHQWLTEELAPDGLPVIVPSHGEALARLPWKGDASMHELASFAHRTRPTMTVLVAKLERMGLAVHEKSETDGRGVVISLTKKGESFRHVFETCRVVWKPSVPLA